MSMVTSGKPLSFNEIRSRAAEFIITWRENLVGERQDAQSFVRDLLQVYGITESRAALYEKQAQRTSTGGKGYIDALVPGLLLVEMKTAGNDLGLAEIQALDYMNSLTDAEMPRYVLTSDFQRFRLLDRLAENEDRVIEFSIEQLHQFADKFAFLAGYQTRKFGSKQQENASIEAAKIMAGLYEALEGSGYSDHEASIFLVRTLFCLYADDSGIWERDLFTDYVEHRTSTDGSDLGAQLVTLFQVMNQPVVKRAKTLDEITARFPYVNGGIFTESLSIPFFDRTMRNLLVEACAFDWRELSPAIFGSLFQAVKSPEARRSLGEHYTTETNILKTIGPLFLDELKDKFQASWHEVRALRKLRIELSEIRVLDPACGSGNFLIVAYRELRQLELDILLRMQALGDTKSVPTLYFERSDLAVQLENIAGIEIEDWPAHIAKTAIRLTDHQANMAMELALGKAPETLPLDTVLIIHVGNALHMDWRDVIKPSGRVFVIGNPPFLGDNTRGTDQQQDLQEVWGQGTTLSRLDYVTGWHAKSLEMFSDPGYSGEWAFVTTNSITQGDQVPRLFKPIFNAGWIIKFAHRTFAWSTEAPGAAAVHCVIVGFTKNKEVLPRIFNYASPKSEPVEIPVNTGINAYLLDAPNILVEKRSNMLSPSLTKTWRGSMPSDGGNLVVEQDEYNEVTGDPVAAKYLHPYMGAYEMLHNIPRWCFWLENLTPEDLKKSPLLRSRIQAVKDFRAASKAASTREYPHHHLFRQLAKQETDYVCVPRVVSETRDFFTVAFYKPEVIAGDSNFTIADPDGFQFAIMSSSMFITWQKAIGGRLKSDLRFASTLTWYTFPLPLVDGALRDQIIAVGKDILVARGLHPERSLAQHYNPLAMSKELRAAHAKLDRAVDKAFKITEALRSNEERLKILFSHYMALYEE